jgi:hypothetical protein
MGLFISLSGDDFTGLTWSLTSMGLEKCCPKKGSVGSSERKWSVVLEWGCSLMPKWQNFFILYPDDAGNNDPSCRY